MSEEARSYVDEATGEMLEAKDELLVADIPSIAQWIQTLRRQVEQEREYLANRINVMTESCEFKIAKKNEKIATYMQTLERLFETTGERSVNYTQIGTVRYRQHPVRLNDKAYDDMSQAEQDVMYSKHGEYFRVKQTIKPDKRKIIDELKQGGTLNGFSLNPSYDTFEFKEEK
ncbi:MAG: hypothetical protein U9N86_03285 [Bacteroidota bacterium]|nr:hypothetical protein [Bacteroidota bacterium]